MSFRDFPWRLTYRASFTEPTDLLHEFYLPALARAVRYDRMAGYFRPSSLASASQGCTAFIGRDCRIRLAVAAELDSDDMSTSLGAGDTDQLCASLTHHLEGKEQWPIDVQRGMGLLAWMIKNHLLEVKLALRVHTKTGEPLAFDSGEDGYLRRPWAVLTDEAGDSIYLSGALNESRSGLIRNAENIEVHCDWWGERERERVRQAQREFGDLWENRHPAFRVIALPEAVRRRVVALARSERPREIDGTVLSAPSARKPSPLEWLAFALIKDAPRLPGGKYIGMETATVEPWPHQRIVARRLIESWPYSFLLCDEVGLGKTIESGLAMRSLYLSGYLKRILIAAPAHLTAQWQREMAEKFFLPFARALSGIGVQHAWLLPFRQVAQAESLYEHPLTIVSTQLMVRSGRREQLEHTHGFELALLDEAQCARRANPTEGTAGHPHYNQLYAVTEKLVRPKSRSLWLATATPMQLHEVEAVDLVRLTRRAGAFLYDPSVAFCYYRLLSELRRNGTLGAQEWSFLNRAVRAVEQQDPTQWKYIQATVIAGEHEPDVQRWLADPAGVLSPAAMEAVRRLLFAAAPLSRTMLRHTRALLEEYRLRGELTGKLPKRTLLPVPEIHFTDQERAIYDRLRRYCTGLAERLTGSGAMRSAIGFFLNFLQLRFASSLYAIRCTLERRQDKVAHALKLSTMSPDGWPDEDLEQALFETDEGDEDATVAFLRWRTPADLTWERLELESMLEELRDLSGRPSKFQVLLDTLEARKQGEVERIRQTVIFTRFFDTLTDIALRLIAADRTMRLGWYSGPACRYRAPETFDWIDTSREEVNRRFLRGDIDVLLCTDAAAEGLNLQTADLLVNYDLPWNPMKVEQRIGRIDRIGQLYDEIQVLNLCYPDSAEQFVYGRLLTRLQEIMVTVGRQNISLLPVSPREFQELAEGRLSGATLEVRVRERLEQLERRNAAFDIPAREQYEMYSRLASRQPLPVTLDGVFDALTGSAYLGALGCRRLEVPGGSVLLLENVPGVASGAGLTASRELYERGSLKLQGELHFATWGQPVFEAVLAAVLAHKTPRCVRKIEVPVPASTATLIGYAVPTPSGIKLVKSLAELPGLDIDVSADVSADQASSLRAELQALAREEGRSCGVADWVEASNEECGRAEEAMHYFAAARLLEYIAENEHMLFRSAIASLEAQLADHDVIRIARLPVSLVIGHKQLLFDVCASTKDPDNFHVDLPRFMFSVLYDAARREAEALRISREHLKVGQVVERLKREAEHALTPHAEKSRVRDQHWSPTTSAQA